MPGHCDQARLRTRLLRELPGTAGGTTASPSPRRADGPKNNGADRADRVAGAGRALAGCSPCSRDPRGSLPVQPLLVCRLPPRALQGRETCRNGIGGGLNVVGLGFGV